MYLTVPTTRSGKANSGEAVDPDAEAEIDAEADSDEESAESTNGSKAKKR